MKITSIEAERLTLPYKHPFVTSFAVWHEVKNVLVKIHTDAGLVGIGEAAPTPQYDGETQEGTLEKIRDLLAPALVSSDPMELIAIEKSMERAVVASHPAKAALDIALHDLLGKAFNVPVHVLLGGLVQARFTSSRCLSFGAPDQMVADAKACMAEGYTTFEVKMSGDADKDWESIGALIESLPRHVVMIFDPNEKWGASNALEIGLMIGDKWGVLRNVYFEQPVSRYDLRGMAKVRSRIPIQIVADESVTNPEAVLEIARLGAADMVNIKIEKLGGIRPCLRAITVAELAGIRYRIDCMGETRIANTAGAHLAAATNQVLADLDTHLNIVERSAASIRGGLELKGGNVVVPRTPGLGVHLET